VLAFSGARGRDAGAPGGVTDFKAAIRYTRYNKGLVPGDMNKVFSFGMSGGGAQSALIGSTGDSELYTPYLEAIGAVDGVSDAVIGSMCWCPITNLDSADMAYEWNLGVTRTGLTEWQQTVSDGLAYAYANYINGLELQDAEGNILTLETSEDGIYQAGTYYDYVLSVIEGSLNHFLSDNEFPYTVASSGSFGGGMGGFGGRGNMGGEGGFAGFGGQKPEGNLPEGEMPDFGNMGDFGGMGQIEDESYEAKDNITRTESASAAVSLSGTYETVEDYIAALNEPYEWVSYDSETNTVKITSVKDFVVALKVASKNLGAFDDVDGSQGENQLFGYGDGNGAHFDAILATLVAGSDYEEAYAADLVREDALGNTVDVRLNMYNPMYYLYKTYAGYQTSTVAKYWRIRTGINQGDTALNTEINLALALESNPAVESVDFETVWGMAHTEAERTGSSTKNFITWVNDCVDNDFRTAEKG